MKRSNTILIAGLTVIAVAAVFVWRRGSHDRFDQFQHAIVVYDDNTPSWDSNGVSLHDQLKHAISSGNEELVLRLLARRSLPNTPDSQQSDPLVPAAIGDDRLAIARHLLDAGYDIHAKNRNSRTALHLAALYASIDAVEFLFDNAFVQLDASDDYGRTALMLAIEQRRYEITKLLLQKGADPNVLDRARRAAIHLAVSNSDHETVELLLDHGANANVSFRDGGSILKKALEKDNLRIARMLLRAGAQGGLLDGKAVRDAAGSGRSNLIHLLVQAGVELNIPDKKGDSAIVYAVKNRRAGAVKALLDGGVDPDTVDHYGRSVLGQAINCIACVEHLLSAGANINYPGQSVAKYADLAANPPLIWAILSGLTGTVERLLSAGADIDMPDNREGRPPIVHAARAHGMADMIRLLVEHGADPNSKDAGQWPALVQAVAFSDTATVTALIDAGANVNTANWHGWTPLMAAAANGDIAMAKLLLSNGADVDARTRKGWTALSETHHYGHFDLSALLEAAGATDPINPPMRTSKDRGKLEINIKVHD